MSNSILCQIWHKKRVDNKEFSKIIVNILREGHSLAEKDVARDLYVRTSRVHNWFHKKTGMTALDLLMLMWRYSFIQQSVLELMLSPFDESVSLNQQLDEPETESI